MIFQSNGYWKFVKYKIHNYKEYPFIDKIDNLIVTNIKTNSFEISVVCSLINEENELEENTLIYHYER